MTKDTTDKKDINTDKEKKTKKSSYSKKKKD